MSTSLCVAFFMGFSLTLCAVEESPLSTCVGFQACHVDLHKNIATGNCSAYLHYVPCHYVAGEKCKISMHPQFTKLLQEVRNNCTMMCSPKKCGTIFGTDDGNKDKMVTEPDHTDSVPSSGSNTAEETPDNRENKGGSVTGNAGSAGGNVTNGPAADKRTKAGAGIKSVGSVDNRNLGVTAANMAGVRPIDSSGNSGTSGTMNVGSGGGTERAGSSDSGLNTGNADTGNVGSADGNGNAAATGSGSAGLEDSSLHTGNTGTGIADAKDNVEDTGSESGASAGVSRNAERVRGSTELPGRRHKESDTDGGKTGVRGDSEEDRTTVGGGKKGLIMQRGTSMKGKAGGDTSLPLEGDPTVESIPINGTNNASFPYNSAQTTRPRLMLYFTVVARGLYIILPNFV